MKMALKKKKGKEFPGPVITGRRLKKITQMFTTGKTCCAFKKWMEDFRDIKLAGLLKHKISVRAPANITAPCRKGLYMCKHTPVPRVCVWKFFGGWLPATFRPCRSCRVWIF